MICRYVDNYGVVRFVFRKRIFRRTALALPLLLSTLSGPAVGQLCQPHINNRDCSDAGARDCPFSKPRFALLLANDQYLGEGHAKLPNLENAVKDAESIAASLRNDFSVHCVKNATLTEAMREFELVAQYQKKLGAHVAKDRINSRDIQFLAYFAGHGVRDKVTGLNKIMFRPQSGSSFSPELLVSITQDVDAMVSRKLVSDHLAPVVLVDACRNTPSTLASRTTFEGSLVPTFAGSGHARRLPEIARVRGPKPIINVAQPGNPDGRHYVAYSTAPGRKAMDVGEDRFSPLLAKEIMLRGASIDVILRRVRGRVVKRWGPEFGPELQSTLAAGYMLQGYWRQPVEMCDELARYFWAAVSEACPDFLPGPCAQSFVPSRFPMACSTWKVWKDRCTTNSLHGEFAQYFKGGARDKCDEPEIAMSALSVPAVKFAAGEAYISLAAKRIAMLGPPDSRFMAPPRSSAGRPIDLGTLPSRLLKSQEIIAGYKTAGYHQPTLSQDQIETVSPVPLFPLPTERTGQALGITLEKGTKLVRDCETLKCQPEWVGVQYRDPKTSQLFRGFVPRSTVFFALPDEIALTYEQDDVVPNEASLQNISASIAKYSLGERGAIRPQVSARYLTDADAASDGRHTLALARAATLSEIFRSAGFKAATIDVYEAQDSNVPAAIAELPAR